MRFFAARRCDEPPRLTRRCALVSRSVGVAGEGSSGGVAAFAGFGRSECPALDTGACRTRAAWGANDRDKALLSGGHARSDLSGEALVSARATRGCPPARRGICELRRQGRRTVTSPPFADSRAGPAERHDADSVFAGAENALRRPPPWPALSVLRTRHRSFGHDTAPAEADCAASRPPRRSVPAGVAYRDVCSPGRSGRRAGEVADVGARGGASIVVPLWRRFP